LGHTVYKPIGHPIIRQHQGNPHLNTMKLNYLA